MSLIKYADKYGVTKVARRYNTCRQNIYRYLKRYNGDIRSLANYGRKPKSHPNQHTKDEIKLIKDMFKKNVDTGLVMFWIKLLK